MSVAFAPSGNLVASGGLDNICTVYNIKAASPKTLRELDAHTGEGAAHRTLCFTCLGSFKCAREKKIKKKFTLVNARGVCPTQATCPAAVSLVTLRS